MKTITFVSLAALVAAPLAAAEKDWRFGDGVMAERWSLLNTGYAICDAGLMQSPVDLANANARGTIELETRYGPGSGKLVLGTEKVQVDFEPGMGMNSGGKDFGLLQVHMHTPSEHAISGERHPLVAHLVHATEQGELGVLGVMFAQGDSNPALQAIIDQIDNGAGSSVTLDMSDLVPDDLAVYRYMGSLTTPPCSEGVNWHVADKPLTASQSQIDRLTEVLGSSARSLQPLGSRLLVAPGE